ncbi:hypothetical protein WDZ92_52210, partial [Nostoc sp. NIES-2111]
MSRRAKVLVALAVIAVAGLSLAWAMCEPHPITAAEIPAPQPPNSNGKALFTAPACLPLHKPGSALKKLVSPQPSAGT